ncbi:hypothetical protein Asp14428_74400 [Actinoplanes sp. NBRC 14428]|nr:hypothetical protein Asp14428_74400 [Actinoplanes sp. NBRC 14428]
MDLALAVLIALATFYAGAVTLLVVARTASVRAAPAAAARVAAVVGAAFLLMVLVAHVAYPATVALAVVLSFAAARRVLVDDLGPRRAAVTGAVAALLIGAAFLFVAYLAVLALIGALGVYRLLRLRLRTRPALVVMGGTLGGLLAAAAATFAAALATM